MIVLFLLCGAMGLVCTGISSSTSNEILGRWEGALKDSRQAPVKINLAVLPSEVELHFGAPRNCTAYAEYVTLEAGAHVYLLAGNSDGSMQDWCANLRNGTMDLRKNGTGTLSFHIASPKKTVSEKTILHKKG